MNKKLFLLSVITFLLALSNVARAQTEDEVGDLASFGREAKFFGYSLTGVVLLRDLCHAPHVQLGPDDRCFIINSTTGQASFDVRDIGRIHFPAQTFENVIYLLTRNQYSYQGYNPGPQNRTASLRYSPYVTLESSALDSPNLTNPMTGRPFHGKVDLPLASARNFSKTFLPTYGEYDSILYSATSTGGFSKKYFMANFGLAESVAHRLITGSITIRLNMSGSTSGLDAASLNYGIRFLGN